MSTFSDYLNGSALTPITAAACAAIAAGANQTDAAIVGPTPSARGLSAVLDAVASLEAAVIALQSR
jgi:hypothetical protein